MELLIISYNTVSKINWISHEQTLKTTQVSSNISTNNNRQLLNIGPSKLSKPSSAVHAPVTCMIHQMSLESILYWIFFNIYHISQLWQTFLYLVFFSFLDGFGWTCYQYDQTAVLYQKHLKVELLALWHHRGVPKQRFNDASISGAVLLCFCSWT